MRLVVFGLTVSSSWGNGHATLWRGLIRALHAAGHHATFFERDVSYYAAHRDLAALPGGDLILYPDWDTARSRARAALGDADAAMVTSFCPDGAAATRLLGDTRGVARLFYDLDTPVTLDRHARGQASELGESGLRPFDLVLSYTGGPALQALRDLGARHVQPLYGWVDPERYAPAPPRDDVAGAAMTYLATYAEDRQATLDRLFVAAASGRASEKFVIGGAQYPESFPWGPNIWFVRHVPPEMHPAFYAAGRLTLNVTRAAMARMGWCPSGRLFEAAACGTPILTDDWPGLSDFFEPGRDILVARSTRDALDALDRSDAELAAIAARARAAVLARHTAAHRADTLVRAIEAAHQMQEA